MSRVNAPETPGTVDSATVVEALSFTVVSAVHSQTSEASTVQPLTSASVGSL